MYKFIVPFQAIINGGLPEHGTVGSISNSPDYNPNGIRDRLTIYYKKRNPNSQVAIILSHPKLASDEEYEKAKETFIDLFE